MVSIPTPGSKRHADIGFAVTLADIAKDLTEWIDFGQSLSKEEHLKRAHDLKTDKYKMRTRGRHSVQGGAQFGCRTLALSDVGPALSQIR